LRATRPAERRPQPPRPRIAGATWKLHHTGLDQVETPNDQGQFLKTKTNAADFQAPASAYRACVHLLPNRGELTAAQQQIIAPLMLKLADCMRSHGITNFPDPTVNAKGITVDPHSLDISSPQFHAAQQACRKYLTEAGKYMPPG